MRWQKIARFAIAVFVIGFAIVVFLAMRPRPSTPSNANDVNRADPKALFESGPGVRKSFDFGKLGFELKYEKLLSYEGGRSKMGGVTLTLPDRNGRTLVVTADEGEFVAPGDTPAESADGKLNGHVKLTTDNGFEVLASEATYAGKTGILTIPGPVTFTKGRMKGSGVGATYDRNRDVIWLLAEARITVTPDAAGAGAIDGSASKAGLARADNFVKLEGTARLTTETRTAEADVITAYLDEKGEKVRTMELREHSRITSTGANADRMTARNIDLMYGDDGRTLQSSKLMEGSVLEFPGTGGAGSKRIAGTTIETRMSPDGATVTNLTAQENVQVDLPVEGDSPARRIKSATLRATGAPGQGIQNAVFEGGVDFTETRPAAGKTPALDRRARSTRLIVDTKPGFGAVERADFRSNVRFVDGELTAEAPKAIYDIARDQLDLSLATGEVGPGPHPQQRADDGAGAQYPRVALDAETQGRHECPDDPQTEEGCSGTRRRWARGGAGREERDARARHAQGGQADDGDLEPLRVRRRRGGHLQRQRASLAGQIENRSRDDRHERPYRKPDRTKQRAHHHALRRGRPEDEGAHAHGNARRTPICWSMTMPSAWRLTLRPARRPRA